MKLDRPISKMTLGTAQLGLDYGIANNEGKPDEDKAFRILESAFANGINCLDTASGYGDSEKVIGKYFCTGQTRRNDITIVTKFKLGNINTSDVESVMMRSVEKSLMNLNTDHLDILLIHDAKEYLKFTSSITKVFEKLLSSGTIRGAGASCYEFIDIEPMLINDIYQVFQIPVNILDMRITNGKGTQKLANKLIFARSVFLQGLFFMDPSHLKGNLKQIGKYLVAINNIVTELNIPLAQLAVTYVKSLHYVDSLVIGADNPDQIMENTKIVDSEPFQKDVMELIEKRLKGAPDWLFLPYLWDKQND